MVNLCLALVPLAFLVSLIATRVVRDISIRAGAHDTAPVPGQVKEAARRVPNTGGIAIFLGIALPMVLMLWQLSSVTTVPNDFNLIPADLHEHLPGLQNKAADAGVLLGCLLGVHILGLADDRRPLGPWTKLAITLALVTGLVIGTDTRMLTMLDPHVGGRWLSVTLTVLWITAIANAMNFLDNMDGLAGGVALVASSMFLWTSLLVQQWFVAACFALTVGATAGFLVFNFPLRGAKGKGASIFMGDGGSLVLGALIAFLGVRLTYAAIGETNVTWAGTPGGNGPWYAVLMPLATLAVPVYDMLTVCLIRIRQGRSPFVGDLNHLSHRLVRRGLSKRAAVVVICSFTAITGLCGILLLSASTREASVLAALVALLMTTLAILEFAGNDSGIQPPPQSGRGAA